MANRLQRLPYESVSNSSSSVASSSLELLHGLSANRCLSCSADNRGRYPSCLPIAAAFNWSGWTSEGRQRSTIATFLSSCDTNIQSGCHLSRAHRRSESSSTGLCWAWATKAAETGLRVRPVFFMQVSSNIFHFRPRYSDVTGAAALAAATVGFYTHDAVERLLTKSERQSARLEGRLSEMERAMQHQQEKETFAHNRMNVSLDIANARLDHFSNALERAQQPSPAHAPARAPPASRGYWDRNARMNVPRDSPATAAAAAPPPQAAAPAAAPPSQAAAPPAEALLLQQPDDNAANDDGASGASYDPERDYISPPPSPPPPPPPPLRPAPRSGHRGWK